MNFGAGDGARTRDSLPGRSRAVLFLLEARPARSLNSRERPEYRGADQRQTQRGVGLLLHGQVCNGEFAHGVEAEVAALPSR